MPMLDLPLEQLKEYKGISQFKDFDACWQAAWELDATLPRLERRKADTPRRGGCELYLPECRARSMPNMRPPPGPPACWPFSYTVTGDWMGYLPYVSQGLCVAAMDCRARRPQPGCEGALQAAHQSCQIIQGVWDEAVAILPPCVLDTVQLYRVVSALRRWTKPDGSHGASRALSIAYSARRAK